MLCDWMTALCGHSFSNFLEVLDCCTFVDFSLFKYTSPPLYFFCSLNKNSYLLIKKEIVVEIFLTR